MLYLGPQAQRLLAHHKVEPRDDWSPSLHGRVAPPSSLSEHVRLDDVVRHVASVRRAAVPSERRSITCVRAPRLTASFDAPTVKELRPHQLDAVRATVFHGASGTRSVRHGIWVMPCGSGKTLTGVMVAKEVAGKTLVVVPNAETGVQWAREFADAGVKCVVLGSDELSVRELAYALPAMVVIATWKLLSTHFACPIAEAAPQALCLLDLPTYDLVLLDEVHLLPAPTHRQAIRYLGGAAIVGMTAETVRSDGQELVDELPVLYCMDRNRSETMGITLHLQRTLVLVNTTPELLTAYEAAGSEARRLIALLNPQKLVALVGILRSEASHKVIVYCDKLRPLALIEKALRQMAALVGFVFVGTLSGQKNRSDRCGLLERLRKVDSGCALMTRAGSTSLDVPDVDCVIELDVGDMSIQKNTQRNGRAQRVHANKSSARFFTLVSAQTREEHFARERTRRGVDPVDELPWPLGQPVTTLGLPTSAAGVVALVDRLLAPTAPSPRKGVRRKARLAAGRGKDGAARLHRLMHQSTASFGSGSD